MQAIRDLRYNQTSTSQQTSSQRHSLKIGLTERLRRQFTDTPIPELNYSPTWHTGVTG